MGFMNCKYSQKLTLNQLCWLYIILRSNGLIDLWMDEPDKTREKQIRTSTWSRCRLYSGTGTYMSFSVTKNFLYISITFRPYMYTYTLLNAEAKISNKIWKTTPIIRTVQYSRVHSVLCWTLIKSAKRRS